MRTRTKIGLAVLIVILLLGALAWWLTRGDRAELPLDQVTGTDPVIAQPDAQTFPTVGVAKPIGWDGNAAPTPAPGLVVNRFAEGLDHPRILYTLPNGDVLVAQANRPENDPAAEESPGLIERVTGWVQGLLFRRAGAAVPSPNSLVLLRDADANGMAEERHLLRDDLNSPGGMVWRDGHLYVANTDAVLRYDYQLGQDVVTGEPVKLMSLPGGGNHWMRNIVLNDDGTRLYVTVGSASNIGEKGMEIEEGRAAIHELNLQNGQTRIYAAGLRNANGLDWNPWSGELWTTVNERDMLGSDLVPDYLTNVPVGANYGWPWVYWDEVIDERVKAPMPQYLTEYTRTPEYALGPHVAALGLAFTQEGARMGPRFSHGAFIARHGSWNRKPLVGYDVVYVAFDDRGNPVGKPQPVLQPFLADQDTTRGRPTWVTWDRTGGLLVSDDTANIIWRVIAPNAPPAPAAQRLRNASLPPVRELTGDPRRAFENPPADIQPTM
ncbi:sorbosone dehydrogenase family protein [Croceibacterium sp. TMG7-5b_MA50]|uniref:PQQ-dependent sugar dehydrogenase n=1 Tax=Croceibacterium sp. TMG7-5b_MA50 TaxID=3121290 RepID=UPI003221F632